MKTKKEWIAPTVEKLSVEKGEKLLAKARKK